MKTAPSPAFLVSLFCLFVVSATGLPGQEGSSPAAVPTGIPQPKVARVWHGRTEASRADEYFAYLNEAGVKKIQAIAGNLGVQVLRRTTNNVTEFTVISYWESREAIRKFAGEDIEKTHNLPRDAEFLLGLEPTVSHFDVLLNEWKQPQ